jgi:hypothetical protein
MLVKTETGATRDVSLLEVTKENYICPAGEEMQYHCRIEVKKFNAETGERQSHPRIQKFGKKVFENNCLHNLRKHGYTVDILHDPNDFIKGQRAKMEESAKKAAKANAKKAEEEKKKEREAMKAEILAELQAKGTKQ